MFFFFGGGFLRSKRKRSKREGVSERAFEGEKHFSLLSQPLLFLSSFGPLVAAQERARHVSRKREAKMPKQWQEEGAKERRALSSLSLD